MVQAVPNDNETPEEAFERLRQALDVIKTNHYDPWNWHGYLGEDPVDEVDSDEEDVELLNLKPKARKNIDRLKAHLLTFVQELQSAGHAADMAYYHVSVNPDKMKDCVIILGTSGDVDSDLLLGSDGSPEKVMAALQDKLDKARARIEDLEGQLLDLQQRFADESYRSEVRLNNWTRYAMLAEEAISRLDARSQELNESLERERELQADYHDLYTRHVRASRMMLYKARQGLRDRIFMQNKKENLFYAFQGFMYILQQEKEERIRQEMEEMRDAVEFALRNEVRYLLGENANTYRCLQMLTEEANRLKNSRRELAKRIIHKQRPFERLEYLKFVWELWLPLRAQLALEKALEREEACRDSIAQQLIHTSSLMLPMTRRCDELQMALMRERIEHDLTRREVTAAGALQLQSLAQRLRDHRLKELYILARIHKLDLEAKEERIAVLEREIAEDKHIQALKGMVVDLESNLRRAMDRRKQRSFVVPPGGGTLCSQCGRENMFRGWKEGNPLARSASDVELRKMGLGAPQTLGPIIKGPGPLTEPFPPELPPTLGKNAWPEKQATYSPVWH